MLRGSHTQLGPMSYREFGVCVAPQVHVGQRPTSCSWIYVVSSSSSSAFFKMGHVWTAPKGPPVKDQDNRALAHPISIHCLWRQSLRNTPLLGHAQV
jgi:hypothetical protein